MSYPLRLPEDVEQAMKKLAEEHGRSLNNEIVQACKAWIREKGNTMINQEECEQFLQPCMSEVVINSPALCTSRLAAVQQKAIGSSQSCS